MADEQYGVVGGGNHDPDAHVEPAKRDAKPADPSESVELKSAKLARTPRVYVDNRAVRGDHDALEGHEVYITHGDYKESHGVFLEVKEYDEKTGYPTECLVRLKDTSKDADLIICKYEWLQNSKPHGTR